MKLMPVGIDIAKNVFQVHHVDAETKDREPPDQAREVPGVLREPHAVLGRDGSMRRCSPLGQATDTDGA